MNGSERMQTRLMTLISDYKVANNRYQTLPKIGVSFCIAIIGFTASLLSLIFGCLCFSDSDIFNYIITGFIILLFLVVLFLQLFECTGLMNRMHESALDRAEHCDLIKYNKTRKNKSFMYDLQRRAMKRRLIENLLNNDYVQLNNMELNDLSEEELLDVCLREFGAEEMINDYEECLKTLKNLIALREKHVKRQKWCVFILSAVAVVVSAVYIFINVFN